MLSRRASHRASTTTVPAPLRAALVALVGPALAVVIPSLTAVACGSSSPPGPKGADVVSTSPSTSSMSGPSSSSGATAGTSTSGGSGTGGTTSTTPAASASAAPSLEDLGENALGNIVGANRGRFRACYDDVKKKKPKLANGTYAIEFWVNVDGTVKSASYSKKGSEFEDADLETCIIGQLKTITFPKSSAGKEHHTTYQFGFNLKS